MFRTSKGLCPLPQSAREDKKEHNGYLAKDNVVRMRLKDNEVLGLPRIKIKLAAGEHSHGAASISLKCSVLVRMKTQYTKKAK